MRDLGTLNYRGEELRLEGKGGGTNLKGGPQTPLHTMCDLTRK